MQVFLSGNAYGWSRRHPSDRLRFGRPMCARTTRVRSPAPKAGASALIALKKEATASLLDPARLNMRSQDTTGKVREGVRLSLAWIENVA
jgi:hypothetical protein